MKTINFLVTHALAAVSAISMAGEIKPYDQLAFDKLAASGKPVVVAVYATWCTTCKAQKPIEEELMRAPAYRDVTMMMIDFDAAKPLVAKYHVSMQSTLIAFKGGKEVGRSVGDTTPAGIDGLFKKTLN